MSQIRLSDGIGELHAEDVHAELCVDKALDVRLHRCRPKWHLVSVGLETFVLSGISRATELPNIG